MLGASCAIGRERRTGATRDATSCIETTDNRGMLQHDLRVRWGSIPEVFFILAELRKLKIF